MIIRYLNPRYDTIFKMLLENNEFAQELISVIIGREIVELIAEPQEKSAFKIDILKVVVYRKDYRAKIKTTDKNGKELIETVRIEMQKSSISPHIDRFREYIGAEYAKPDKVEVDKGGNETKTYLPIISLFFIERTFNKSLPAVLGVGKKYFDVLDNRKEYTGKPDKYVELLTHEAYFIQLNKLPEHFKEKHKVLELFMGKIIDNEEIFMEIEIDKAVYMNSIIGRALFELAGKIGDKHTVEQVKIERKMIQTVNSNYYQKELILKQRLEILKNKQAIQQSKQELQQNKQELQQNKQELQQSKQEIQQKDQALINSVKAMLKTGMSLEEIQAITQLPLEMIKTIK